MHLAYHAYGPYAANNKQVTKIDQILIGEAPKSHNGRQDNIIELLKTQKFINAVAKSNNIPLIVCGDFNSPSHLDWTEATKKSHGDWIVQWPSTYLLQHGTGLTDSFREIFPDPVIYPGISWSTVNKATAEWEYSIPEPQDRIDFIMYKGMKVTPRHSFTYSGHEPLVPMPNHQKNDYPSDHFSVVTDFVLKLA